MIPCLYAETETAFTSNGIGKLCDALSCYVTEKRNGAYELKMGYPSFGIHAEDVVEGNIILAKPSERATAQPSPPKLGGARGGLNRLKPHLIIRLKSRVLNSLRPC